MNGLAPDHAAKLQGVGSRVEGKGRPRGLHPPAATGRKQTALHPWQKITAFIIGFVLIIAFLDVIGPHPTVEPVSPTSIAKEPYQGNGCDQFPGAYIVSATDVDTAGPYNIYDLVCSNGIQLSVAR